MDETTISEHAPLVTFINVFTVEPERQRELLNVLTTASGEVMRHLPGFISGNFHASTDGTKIVNYIQWEGTETLEAAQVDPAARAHMKRAMAIAVNVEPHMYEVNTVHHR